jgi:hypothetical protein
MFTAGDEKGPVKLTRRGFLAMLGAAAVAGACASGQSIRAPVQEDQTSATGTRLTTQDLTHMVSPRFPIWEAERGNAARLCLQL